MGTELIKPKRDVDLYIQYSSIVDMPLEWGTREELLEEHPDWGPRIDRADARGTSALWYSTSWDEDHHYNYGQYGSIPRSRLGEITDAYERLGDESPSDHPEILALLDPFEED